MSDRCNEECFRDTTKHVWGWKCPMHPPPVRQHIGDFTKIFYSNRFRQTKQGDVLVFENDNYYILNNINNGEDNDRF